MDAIKIILIVIFIFPLSSMGQKSLYPKDTIFIKFENIIKNKKWLGKYKFENNEYEGILFNIRNDDNKWMTLFYSSTNKIDTLCSKHLKEYTFSNLTEIQEKRTKWIFENKRPPANRNGVFQTYLIESISKDYFVIYPVIWRNEGVVD